MAQNKRGLGTEQEERAIKFLREQGYEPITSNFSCRSGEVDIIARDDAYLCFIEVKYRRTTKVGSPEAAVDFRKQNRICRVADFYLFRYGLPANAQVRFDVVAILGENITLYKNAFDYIPRW